MLKVEPDNAEALAYRGWLVALVGSQGNATDLVQKGEQSLQRAMQVAPNYADAVLLRGHRAVPHVLRRRRGLGAGATSASP